MQGSDNDFSCDTLDYMKIETNSDDVFTNPEPNGFVKNVPTGRGKCMPKGAYLKTLGKPGKKMRKPFNHDQNEPGPSNCSTVSKKVYSNLSCTPFFPLRF